MNFLKKSVDLFILLVFIALVSIIVVLSIKNANNEPLYIEKDFRKLFSEFKKDAKKYKIVPEFSGLTTTFVDTIDLGEGVLAYCIPKFNTIKVSKQKWDNLSDVSRKILLYHEWAHCTLKRDHTDSSFNLFSFTCPTSMMNPYIEPTASCYLLFKEWYDKELFTNPLRMPVFKKEIYEANSNFDNVFIY